jgi:trimeric autotransporter adhesin
MFSIKRKLQLAAGLTALLSLALAVGCRGFFVNPTLTQITVSPATPSVIQGKTQQMTATATFDDGSTGRTTVLWTTTDANVATINASGLLTGVGVGSTSITATAQSNGTITGSTTATITCANIQSITLSPSSQSVMVGMQVQFSAMATTSGGGMCDVTNASVWNSSNTAVATITSGGLVSTLTTGSTNITATSGGITSNIVTLTVN